MQHLIAHLQHKNLSGTVFYDCNSFINAVQSVDNQN